MASWYRKIVFGATGWANFMHGGFLRHQKCFTPDALSVDLSSRSFMVTGANSGIGFETACQLLARGAIVHMVCRNAEKGEKAREEIAARTGGRDRCILHVVDLSLVAQTKAFARSFVASWQRLDVLVNNAGAMVNERMTTAEGLEANFATNVLGMFVLTEELLPALRRAAESNNDARVVVVSSGGMLTQNLDLEDPQCERMDPFDGTFAYAKNKRAQVCLVEWWARTAATQGLSFQSMHPGWVDTPGVEKSMPDFHRQLQGKLRSLSEGADTVVWLAASHEARSSPSGQFFLDRKPQSKHIPMAWSKYSEADVEKLASMLREISQRFEPSREEMKRFERS